MKCSVFHLSLAVLGAIAWTGCATNDPAHPPHSEAYWRQRIAQVHRGMSREEVEKFLPVRSEEVERSVPNGLSSEYAVDSEWRVEVPYDGHGFPGFDEKKNPHLLRHVWAHQMIGDIKLTRRHTKIDWKTHPD
jgi:hypothetical protein